MTAALKYREIPPRPAPRRSNRHISNQTVNYCESLFSEGGDSDSSDSGTNNDSGNESSDEVRLASSEISSSEENRGLEDGFESFPASTEHKSLRSPSREHNPDTSNMAKEKQLSRKRPRPSIESDDEEDLQLMIDKDEDNDEKVLPELEGGVHTDRLVPQPKRYIMLTFKTDASTKFAPTSWPVLESVIRQIPDYAKKLDGVLKKPKLPRCLNISDQKVRNGDSMFQAIAFLTDGSLEPLSSTDPELTGKLSELIDLYEHSVTLDIPVLEVAIIEHIRKANVLQPGILVSFAQECYKEGKACKTGPESSIGQLVKEELTARLPELIAQDLTDEIASANDRLSAQFTAVLVADFKRKQQQQALPGVVKLCD